MARTPELIEFAKEHHLTFITVAALVAYRKKKEKMVHRIANAALPSKYGTFRAIGYENDLDDKCHEVKYYKIFLSNRVNLGTRRPLVALFISVRLNT